MRAADVANGSSASTNEWGRRFSRNATWNFRRESAPSSNDLAANKCKCGKLHTVVKCCVETADALHEFCIHIVFALCLKSVFEPVDNVGTSTNAGNSVEMPDPFALTMVLDLYLYCTSRLLIAQKTRQPRIEQQNVKSSKQRSTTMEQSPKGKCRIVCFDIRSASHRSGSRFG